MSRTHRSKKKKKKEEISSLAIFPFAGKQVRAAVYQRALFNFQATQRMRDGNLFASLGPFSQTLCPLCPLTPRTSSPGRYMKSLPLAWLSILAFFFFFLLHILYFMHDCYCLQFAWNNVSRVVS